MLTCTGSVGIYFGYNIIGATAPNLEVAPYHLDSESIGGLAAAYSIPNMIMPLFGGFITDRLGVRLATVVYSAVVALGAACFWLTLGHHADELSPELRLNCMLASMAIFGLGGESLTVAQKAMLASWFKDSKDFPQLAFATGLTLTFGYIGVVINRWTVPAIAVDSVPQAYLLNVVVCAGSCVSMIVASWLHHRVSKEDTQADLADKNSKLGENLLSPADEDPAPALEELVEEELSAAGQCTDAVREFCTGIRSLPRPFFVLCAMLAISSPLFACFETFGPAVLVDAWGYDIEAADEITSVAQLSGLILMPAIGMLYDAKGHRLAGASMGCVIFALSWLALTVGSSMGAPSGTPLGSTVGVALAASLFFGGTWPCVPLLVEEHLVGTAFGFMTAAQNTCLSIVLVGAGEMRDATGGFDATGSGLALLGAISTILGGVVWRMWTKSQAEIEEKVPAESGENPLSKDVLQAPEVAADAGADNERRHTLHSLSPRGRGDCAQQPPPQQQPQ